MKKQKPVLQLKEQEYWLQIDPDTGKVIGDVKRVDVVVKEVPRLGFEITYLATIIQMIDNIGNKKMQVVKYLLKKMDSNNLITQTIDEIVKGSGISRPTVIETLGILEKSGIIARKTGVVMMSPKLMHKGNAQREGYLMTKFYEVKDGE